MMRSLVVVFSSWVFDVSGGYMKSSARVIADSIANLSRKGLIDTGSSQGRSKSN